MTENTCSPNTPEGQGHTYEDDPHYDGPYRSHGGEFRVHTRCVRCLNGAVSSRVALEEDLLGLQVEHIASGHRGEIQQVEDTREGFYFEDHDRPTAAGWYAARDLRVVDPFVVIDSAHDVETCVLCRAAQASAQTYARVTGSRGSTFRNGLHHATVERCF